LTTGYADAAGAEAQQKKGYIICITGTVIWSFTAIFIRYLTDHYALLPLPLAFWRDLFVFLTLGVVFSVFIPRLTHIRREHWGFLTAYGLVLSLFNAVWTLSVAMNGAAVSTVLAYSSPGITAVIGWRVLHEKLGWWKIAAILLSLMGTVLVADAWRAEYWALRPVGILVGLFSGLGMAGYSLMGRAASSRQINPWSALWFSFGSASLFLLAYNLFLSPFLPQSLSVQLGGSRDLFSLGASLPGWSLLAALAILPTIGGYGLYTVSLGYLPASVANLIATLEPAMTALWAFLLLNERLTPVQIAGSAMILTGLMLLRWQKEPVAAAV
jgi:drug/metabolite transporter (DMT)-like permease